ncbi:MAG: ABC transporter substrate-binding protein [Thalassobaculaceae bacterium]|nr:ABC transporter substrate-binding protein [Thalassobaculaceae bacterium]
MAAVGCVTAALCLGAVPCAAAETADTVIEHRWGETRVDARPERIVTLSLTGVDTFLALGVVPIAYRAWYGGDDNGLWPWASARLPKAARPVVLRGEIDAETVARLRPDLVEAMYSGITRAQYAAISHVAPTLPPLDARDAFAATWRDMLIGAGRATGRREVAHAAIARLEQRIAAIRAAHPEWQGATAVVAGPDGPSIYTWSDPRMTLMRRLGFRMPASARALSLGGFFLTLDRELTAPLDADILLWLDFGGGMASVLDHPLRHAMRAAREGREIVADPDLSAALSYASPLSIPYALDRLVPLLEAAFDGDPATPVPGAPAAGGRP